MHQFFSRLIDLVVLYQNTQISMYVRTGALGHHLKAIRSWKILFNSSLNKSLIRHVILVLWCWWGRERSWAVVDFSGHFMAFKLQSLCTVAKSTGQLFFFYLLMINLPGTNSDVNWGWEVLYHKYFEEWADNHLSKKLIFIKEIFSDT